MRYREIGALTIGEFSGWAGFNGLGHFFSTRRGGFSLPPYQELNLGLDSGDSSERVGKNRELLARSLGWEDKTWVFPHQVGGEKIVLIERGIGEHMIEPPATDALLTESPEVVLVIQVADCVPVLFYDPGRQVIAVAHCGWRGTVARLAEKTLQKMREVFGCRPEDIWAGIGPSIGPECYQVGPEVIVLAEDRLGPGLVKHVDGRGKGMLDLWQANLRQLREAGVKESRVEIAGACPHCLTDKFFSVRGLGEPTGRFACGLTLRK